MIQNLKFNNLLAVLVPKVFLRWNLKSLTFIKIAKIDPISEPVFINLLLICLFLMFKIQD